MPVASEEHEADVMEAGVSSVGAYRHTPGFSGRTPLLGSGALILEPEIPRKHAGYPAAWYGEPPAACIRIKCVLVDRYGRVRGRHLSGRYRLRVYHCG